MKRETWPPQREHISELANMQLSPAHYRAAYTDPRESTPPMNFGTAVHALLLGGARVGIFDGPARRGKAWEDFEAANADKDAILTAPELARAMRVVEAVRADPVAAPLLEGERERSLEWSAYGIQCAGRIDVVNKDGLTDLKTCSLAEPFAFTRRGLSSYMHAKMAWYQRGAKENKLPHETLRLMAVETKPPFAVTVFVLTPRAIEQGDKMVRRWVEKLKNCRASNHWPAYSQCPVDFDVPDDLTLTYGEDPTENW